MMTRLEHERRRRGWSQTQLAAFAAMHQPEISYIERGRMVLSEPQAERLARVVGVPPERLLDEVEAPVENAEAVAR